MEKIVARFKELIARGKLIRELSRVMDRMKDVGRENFAMKRKKWTSSCENLLQKSQMQQFLVDFRAVNQGRGYAAAKIALLLGILESALEEINEGFIFNIQHILHADLFDSVTEQAKDLLKKGHKIPAAVLGRIVIERWLFDLADQNNIKVSKTDKASSVNDKLKTNNIFVKPKWRTTQSHLDTGNSAAHGNDKEFTENDVNSMIQFIENTCI